MVNTLMVPRNASIIGVGLHMVPVQHTCSDAAINIMPSTALMLINRVLRASSRSLNIFAANGNTTLLRVPPVTVDDDTGGARLDDVRALLPLLNVRSCVPADNDDNGGTDDGVDTVGVSVGELRVTTIPPYPGRGIVMAGCDAAPIVSLGR